MKIAIDEGGEFPEYVRRGDHETKPYLSPEQAKLLLNATAAPDEPWDESKRPLAEARGVLDLIAHGV